MSVKFQDGPGSVFSSTASSTNEVVKFLRRNVDQQEQSVYAAKKVRTRSRKVFVSCRDEEHWKTIMERRNNRMNSGFFARPDIPYKDCGKVELNTKTLVTQCLQDIGNYFPEKTSTSVSLTPNEESKSESKTSPVTQDSPVKNIIAKQNWQIQLSSGMLSIKENTEKTEKRIISVKAGQPLSTYLRKEKEEQKVREEAERKKAASFGMFLVDSHERESHVANIDGDTTEQPCRRKVDYIAKLDCLCSLLNTINNMRVRDLKTKVPLPLEVLNLMQKSPNVELVQPNRRSRKSMMVPNIRVRNELIDANNGTKTIASPVSESSNHVDAPITFPLDAIGKTSRNSPYGPQQHQQPLRNRKHSPMQPIIFVSNIVETWDDLITVDTGSRSNRGNSTSQDAYRGVSRMSVNLRLIKRKNLTLPTKTTSDPLPPWQRISLVQKDKNKKDISILKSQGTELKSQKHQIILDRLKSDFEKTKQFNAEKVKKDLHRLTNASAANLESLQFRTSQRKKFEQLKNNTHEWKQRYNLANPPPWYEALTNEQKSCQLDEDDCINIYIQQLTKFLDIKASTQTLAKLCLLVFSLPTYQLCTVQMQEAIKFFISEITEMKEDYLSDWMSIRKLITKDEDK